MHSVFEIQHQFPTPPRSTSPQPVAAHFKDSLQSLELLTAFYKQECLWVERTRAALVDEHAHRSEQRNSQTHDAARSLPSPDMSSTASLPEIDDDDDESEDARSNEETLGRQKRKRVAADDGAPESKRQKVSDPGTGMYMLDKYRGMMQGRMESCQRVHRLVDRASLPR